MAKLTESNRALRKPNGPLTPRPPTKGRPTALVPYMTEMPRREIPNPLWSSACTGDGNVEVRLSPNRHLKIGIQIKSKKN